MCTKTRRANQDGAPILFYAVLVIVVIRCGFHWRHCLFLCGVADCRHSTWIPLAPLSIFVRCCGLSSFDVDSVGATDVNATGADANSWQRYSRT
jgi:hypothetical protein